MAITERQARALKPGDKLLMDGKGLRLLPSKSTGCGKWVFRYTSPTTGKRRDMGLGTYPETGIAAARKGASEARELIATGSDPLIVRDADRAIPTFEAAARERWAQVATTFRSARHRQNWISGLERHVFPAIGTVRVDRLTPQSFADALRPAWDSVPDTASRLRQRCSDTMAMCWARGWTQANPLDVVGHLLPPVKLAKVHQPAMPWQAVPAFVASHLSRAPVLGACAALLFLILTGARSGEVRGATWGEIDLEKRLWVVPASRMKMKKGHRVPLSTDAVALLRVQREAAGEPPADAWVFPAIRGGQLSDMALTSILRRVKAPSDTPGRIATAHGFRASFRNWCADAAVDRELAERALAHTVSNQVQAAYERTDRLQARVRLMQRWADHIMGREDVKVISLRREA